MTERINERTKKLDAMSTAELLQVMNEEDQQVALAVALVQSSETMEDSRRRGHHL